MDPTRCLQHLELYHQTAAQHGWQPTSDNIQYQHWVWVDETDEKAQTANAHYVGAGFFALFSGASPDVMKAIGTCGAAGAGVGRGVRDESGLTFPDGPPNMPPPPMVPGAPFVGNPPSRRLASSGLGRFRRTNYYPRISCGPSAAIPSGLRRWPHPIRRSWPESGPRSNGSW